MFLMVLQANEPLSLAESDSVSPEDPQAGNLKVSTPGGSWDDGWNVVGPVRSPRRSTSYSERSRFRRIESRG